MATENYQFAYQVFTDRQSLSKSDAELLDKALEAAQNAYAPYSQFQVGAAARLANGIIVFGSNQENASYPVGICAERVLLSNAAIQYPGIAIESMAISYHSNKRLSDQPISPCGMCRQALVEYETRVNATMRLILAGETGEIIVTETALHLLPFAFGNQHLH
jgi:cytidine deaminase